MMKISPVSFGKIFDIRYKQGIGTKAEDVENRIEKDQSIAFQNRSVVFVDRIEHINNSTHFYGKLSSEGLRIFTGDSYRDYTLLKSIDQDAADQYAAKEAKQLVVTV